MWMEKASYQGFAFSERSESRLNMAYPNHTIQITFVAAMRRMTLPCANTSMQTISAVVVAYTNRFCSLKSVFVDPTFNSCVQVLEVGLRECFMSSSRQVCSWHAEKHHAKLAVGHACASLTPDLCLTLTSFCSAGCAPVTIRAINAFNRSQQIRVPKQKPQVLNRPVGLEVLAARVLAAGGHLRVGYHTLGPVHFVSGLCEIVAK